MLQVLCRPLIPSGKGYKTLSVTEALVAKNGKSNTSTSSTKQTPKPMAATAPSSDDVPNAIATVLPLASDYNSNSDENADLSNCDVSALIKSKHLIWHCQIHGLKDDFPRVTCTLIDNRAHIVLIHPELVSELNLKKHCLFKLKTVDVAMQNGQKSCSELYEYVKLS